MIFIEKFIYGLCLPFRDYPYWKYDQDSQTYIFERIHPNGIITDGLVGALEDHSFDKKLGRTDDGTLSLYLNERGLFFRLKPTNPAALSCYKRVKRNALRHCSIAYHFKKEDRIRVNADEEKIKELYEMNGDQAVFEELRQIQLYEISLTNYPKLDYTFCTVDKRDKRLEGIDFDSPIQLTKGMLKGL